jgi:cysteine desulfuration protein SufE
VSSPESASPFGRSITIDEVKQNFEFFDDWEDRYRFIIDLGKQLPRMDDALKIPANIIHGCQSQVWINTARVEDQLEFELDSDAHIVRGLIAIVLSAVNAKTAAEILDYDLLGLFDGLDLISHLSPARGNGLAAMVKRIKGIAAQELDG